MRGWSLIWYCRRRRQRKVDMQWITCQGLSEGAHLRGLLKDSLLKGLQHLRGPAPRIMQVLGPRHLLH